MSLWSRIWNVVRGHRLNSEIDAEFESHIQEAIADGRDPDEARRAFGPRLLMRENVRDISLIPWLESLLSDSIFGARQLLKTKVTSLAAILSLGLAIGASISAFRLVDALLFRPLPISAPDRLYALSRLSHDLDGSPDIYDSQPYPLFTQMRERVRDQADLLAISYDERRDLTFNSAKEWEKAHLQYVSSNMFTTFGLQPALGRLLTETDDAKRGASPYAVISYGYWSQRFGKNPNLIGQTFRLDDTIYQIIGVSGKHFSGIEPGTSTDIFVPITMRGYGALDCTDCGWFRVLAQLKPGASLGPVRDQLTAAFNVFQEQRAKEVSALPEALQNLPPEMLLVNSAPAGVSGLQTQYSRPLAALCVLVALLLLIGCANVANLMTAQAASREREMALRVSVGAGRARLVQLVLLQSAWLAIISAMLGSLLAWWAAPYIVAKINPPDNPAQLNLQADFRVTLFSLALAISVTFLFGLAPALRASYVKPVTALKGGENPHFRRRMMHALIAVQVAFCFLVLFVGGVFVLTFERLSHQSTGFSTDRLLAMETVTSQAQLPMHWQEVVRHLRSTPGVESVSLAGWPLLTGEQRNNFIPVHGQQPGKDLAYFLPVLPGWIDSMRVPLLKGRDFLPADVDPGAAIVTRTFTKRFFPNEDPIGKTFQKTEPRGKPQRYQIVGLVEDVRYQEIRRPPLPVFFLPFASLDDAGALQPYDHATLLVRTSNPNPLLLAPVLRQEVSRANSAFRVSNLRTQQGINEAQTVRERLLATLAIFFAAVALLLSGIGLYGVLYYSVQQRRREIGIRIAVGAQSHSVIRLIVADISAAVLLGAAAGLILGLTSVGYIRTLLYQVGITDAAVLAFPSLAMFLTACIATFPTILCAIGTDPAKVLRID